MTQRAPQSKEDLIREMDMMMMSRLDLYCLELVKIKDKSSGAMVPLNFKKSQRLVHDRLEAQKRQTGKVRALVLKYRQGGISTYIAGRFYHGTSLNFGQITHILTHEDKATQNLFRMAKTIHDEMHPDYRPTDTAKNANELFFGDLRSGYTVGTARNIQGGGRSSTIHRFHGSECCFWPHADTHFAGVMQAIPNAPGTEVILETTGNGPMGEFYNQWVLAEAGKSEYIAIFLPWMMEDEYRMPLKPGLAFSAEEVEYAEAHGLDEKQLTWAHFKNIELGGDPGSFGFLFMQEYPATAAEAFQTTGADKAFINPKYVLTARKNNFTDEQVAHSPVILGVDCARGGKDKTRIIDRQGRRAGALKNQTIDSDNLMVVADEVLKAIRDTKASLCCIDIGGLGAGVYDRVRQVLGVDDQRIVAVNFGGTPSDTDRYVNKSSEMAARLKEWLMDQAGADIPDDDELHRHIVSILTGPMDARYDSNQRLVMPTKDRIKKLFGFSPDGFDALRLTFAQEVYEMPADEVPQWAKRLAKKQQGSWMSR